MKTFLCYIWLCLLAAFMLAAGVCTTWPVVREHLFKEDPHTFAFLALATGALFAGALIFNKHSNYQLLWLLDGHERAFHGGAAALFLSAALAVPVYKCWDTGVFSETSWWQAAVLTAGVRGGFLSWI